MRRRYPNGERDPRARCRNYLQSERARHSDPNRPEELIKQVKVKNRKHHARRRPAAARDADLRPILEAMRDQTYRDIAEALTDRGIKTPRGGDAWSRSRSRARCG